MHRALQTWKWAGITTVSIRDHLGSGDKEARELEKARCVVESDLCQHMTGYTWQQKWCPSCSL